MKKKEWIWLSTITVVTLLIWAQSLLPAVQSGAQSSAVAAWLKALLGDGPVAVFVVTHIRKIAHFTEFCLLGLLWGGFAAGRRPGAWPLIPGVATAAVDELLQLLSPGRAALVTDVLLDSAGFLTGWLAVTAVVWLWRLLRRRKNTTAA